MLSILLIIIGDYNDMMVDSGQHVLVKTLIKGVMALERWGIYINKSHGEWQWNKMSITQWPGHWSTPETSDYDSGAFEKSMLRLMVPLWASLGILPLFLLDKMRRIHLPFGG
jgi:hypothetical protein